MHSSYCLSAEFCGGDLWIKKALKYCKMCIYTSFPKMIKKQNPSLCGCIIEAYPLENLTELRQLSRATLSSMHLKA